MDRREFLTGLGAAPVLPAASSLEAAAQAAGGAVERARRLRVFVLEHGYGWDWSQLADMLAQANANAVRASVGLHGEGGGWVTMYPSRHLPRHPLLGERNELKLAIDACSRRGVGVFPYNSLTGFINPATLGQHPGWRRVNPRPLKQPGVCFHHPEAVATYAAAAAEVVRDYPVIGMYFDGPNLKEENYCCCSHCQRVSRELFNQEMSMHARDVETSSWREMQLAVQGHGVANIMRAVREAIKAERDVPVLMNVSNPMDYMEHYPAMRHADGALMAEHHRGSRGSALVGALMKVKTGRAFGKAAWCYCPPGPHESEDLVTYENVETRLFGRLWLMHGGTPIIETLKAYLYDPANLPAVRELFDHEDRYGPLYWDCEPVPFAGILKSRQTDAWRSATTPSVRLGHWTNGNFEGAFQLLSETRQQFGVLLDEHLETATLAKYKVVVLANNACLSAAQAEAVRRYVKEGGGLIASLETSLRDEHGRQREDFALSDLFHASFQGVRTDIHYVRIARKHPVTEGLGGNGLIFCPLPYMQVQPLEGAEVVAAGRLLGERGKPGLDRQEHRNVTAPTVIAGTFGRGRVVYFAAPVDELYRDRGFRTVRRLFANAVRWVAQADAPFRIEGPDSIYANLTAGGKRRALHLLNYTGHMYEQPTRKVEWIAPLHEVGVWIRNPEGLRAVRASLLTSGKTVPFQAVAGGVTVQISRLNEHECVIVDYD